MLNFHIFLQPSNGQSNWNWGHGASSKWPFRSFWNIGQSFILLNNGINCIKFVRKKSLRLQRWQHTARQRFCVSYPPLEVDPSRSRVRMRGRGWWWLAYEPSIFEFSYFCNKSVCFFSDMCYRGILNVSLDYVIQIKPNASTYIVCLVHLRVDMN